MDLPQIVTALSAPRSLEEACQLLPDQPGLYAWWIHNPEALPTVHLDASRLLYVGIAQSGPKSLSNLRSRVRGKHIRGVIGNSTLRFSLTALLWESQGWKPCWATDRAQLSGPHNNALSSWMQTHLQVAWLAFPEPWTVEKALITTMEPPLNTKDNQNHPYYPEIKAARSRLISVARETQRPDHAGAKTLSVDDLFSPVFEITPAGIASILRIEPGTLRKRLRALRDEGKIASQSGRWVWAPDSPELKIITDSFGWTFKSFRRPRNAEGPQQ